MKNELWQLLKVRFPEDRNDFNLKHPKGNDHTVPAWRWHLIWSLGKHWAHKILIFGARQEKGEEEREYQLRNMSKTYGKLRKFLMISKNFTSRILMIIYFFWSPTLFPRPKTRNKELEKSDQRLTAKQSASSMELACLKKEPDNRREFVPLEKEAWNAERKDLAALLQAFCYKVASIIQLLQNQVSTKNSILGLSPFLKYSKVQKRS